MSILRRLILATLEHNGPLCSEAVARHVAADLREVRKHLRSLRDNGTIYVEMDGLSPGRWTLTGTPALEEKP